MIPGTVHSHRECCREFGLGMGNCGVPECPYQSVYVGEFVGDVHVIGQWLSHVRGEFVRQYATTAKAIR